jgi:hypothetical protein
MTDDDMSKAIRAALNGLPDPVSDDETVGDRKRREAAEAFGVPAELADRLSGETEEEWRADARAWRDSMNASGYAFTTPSDDPPVGHLDGGVRQTTPMPPDFDQILRARADHVRFGRDQLGRDHAGHQD